MTQPRYRGVFPVAPTVFGADGALDLDGQRRAVDFMTDAGSNGLCILANFSEQFVLTDAERDAVKALSGVDLAIQPGEIHAMAGENGAGKST